MTYQGKFGMDGIPGDWKWSAPDSDTLLTKSQFALHNTHLSGKFLDKAYSKYREDYKPGTGAVTPPPPVFAYSGQFGMDGIPGDWNWVAPASATMLTKTQFAGFNPSLSGKFLDKAYSEYQEDYSGVKPVPERDWIRGVLYNPSVGTEIEIPPEGVGVHEDANGIVTEAPDLSKYSGLRFTFEIVGTGRIVPSEDPDWHAGAFAYAYVAHKSNNYQTNKERIYSEEMEPMVPGLHTLEVHFKDAWSYALEGIADQVGKDRVLREAGFMGIVFGGGPTKGHGVVIKNGEGWATFRIIGVELLP